MPSYDEIDDIFKSDWAIIIRKYPIMAHTHLDFLSLTLCVCVHTTFQEEGDDGILLQHDATLLISEMSTPFPPGATLVDVIVTRDGKRRRRDREAVNNALCCRSFRVAL